MRDRIDDQTTEIAAIWNPDTGANHNAHERRVVAAILRAADENARALLDAHLSQCHRGAAVPARDVPDARPVLTGWREFRSEWHRYAIGQERSGREIATATERHGGPFGWRVWASAKEYRDIAEGTAPDIESAKRAADAWLRANPGKAPGRLPDEAHADEGERPDHGECCAFCHGGGIDARGYYCGTNTKAPAPPSEAPRVLTEADIAECIAYANATTGEEPSELDRDLALSLLGGGGGHSCSPHQWNESFLARAAIIRARKAPPSDSDAFGRAASEADSVALGAPPVETFPRAPIERIGCDVCGCGCTGPQSPPAAEGDTIEGLRKERGQLRAHLAAAEKERAESVTNANRMFLALVECINAVGAGASHGSSIDFLCRAPEEVRSVIAKVKSDHARAVAFGDELAKDIRAALDGEEASTVYGLEVAKVVAALDEARTALAMAGRYTEGGE